MEASMSVCECVRACRTYNSLHTTAIRQGMFNRLVHMRSILSARSA